MVVVADTTKGHLPAVDEVVMVVPVTEVTYYLTNASLSHCQCPDICIILLPGCKTLLHNFVLMNLELLRERD